MNASLAEGYARARAVTRLHAKSFFFASFLLFGARRRAAFALYAFCRRLDDMVDGDGELGVAPLDGLPVRLQCARGAVAELYRTLPGLAAPALRRGADSGGEAPLHPSELAALRDTVHRFHIPEAPFQDLISGMEMDLTHSRYRTFAELDLYCYRVAGTVGLMLAPVLGYSDASALPAAADLGRAMQLTNILRDVKEDLARGRIYLPAQELAAFGVSEAALAAGTVDEHFRALMRFQIERARSYYLRAAFGIGFLQGFGAQRMVRLMGALYGGILRSIEGLHYDVFRTRAFVGLGRKLGLAAVTLVRPGAGR